MSIVGTRPPLIGEVSEYELHHRARLASLLYKARKPGGGRKKLKPEYYPSEAVCCL